MDKDGQTLYNTVVISPSSKSFIAEYGKASGPVVEFCWATGEGRLHTPASFDLRIRALVDKGLRMLWDGKALEVGNSRFRAPHWGEHFQRALPTGAWGFNRGEEQTSALVGA
jgi:hypothetical protein